MPNIYKLDILSPEGISYSGKVSQASFPTNSGIITVLAGHTALITKLSGGEIEIIEENGNKRYITIVGGFAEISQNEVSVIADFAIRSEEINDTKINEAKKSAEELLKQKDKISSAVAEHELQREILKLKLFEHTRKNKSKGAKY